MYSYQVHQNYKPIHSVILGYVKDPNNIYPWQAEGGTKDKLDFRHHNYKEMRKVRRSFVVLYIKST